MSGKSERQLRDFFDSVSDTGEGFHANCPRCDDSEKKFYFNEAKQVGCCFHADCPWFKDRGGATEFRLRAFFGEGFRIKAPEILIQSKEADVRLPKEFDLLDDDLAGDAHTKRMVLAYLAGRGLPKKLLARAQVGYCETGKFWGYIIFPVFDNGEVVYWQGRRFKNRDPKFWNPASSKKTEIVFNLHTGMRPKRIVLVESVINALTLETERKPTVSAIFALLGQNLSDIQMHKILVWERHVEEIVIALDSDAWKSAVEIADKLYGSVPSVKLAKIPEGEDVNSVGRMAAWEAIFEAIPYHRENRIDILHGGKS